MIPKNGKIHPKKLLAIANKLFQCETSNKQVVICDSQVKFTTS